MNLVQFAHGVLVEAEDFSNTVTKALPSFNPMIEHMPANPFASTEVAGTDTSSGADQGAAVQESATKAEEAPAETEGAQEGTKEEVKE